MENSQGVSLASHSAQIHHFLPLRPPHVSIGPVAGQSAGVCAGSDLQQSGFRACALLPFCISKILGGKRFLPRSSMNIYKASTSYTRAEKLWPTPHYDAQQFFFTSGLLTLNVIIVETKGKIIQWAKRVSSPAEQWACALTSKAPTAPHYSHPVVTVLTLTALSPVRGLLCSYPTPIPSKHIYTDWIISWALCKKLCNLINYSC